MKTLSKSSSEFFSSELKSIKNGMERNEFERLYKLADETVSLIGGFTSYLRKRLNPT